MKWYQSDKKHYEKRIDAKGHESESVCIEDEIPFEIPENWEWTRLETLGILETGKTPSTLHKEFFDGPIPFVTPGDISYDNKLCNIERSLSTVGSDNSRTLPEGSVLQVCIGGSAGKTCQVASTVAFNQQINGISPFKKCISNYLYLALCAPLTQEHIEAIKAGTATPIINKGIWSQFLIPIPSLSEQFRICELVDLLQSKISQYDALETAREKLDAELPDRLRKSILQMAVQGKLVPQDPSDEPASALLERIREQRRQLIVEGKMKAPKGGESVIYRASDGGYYEKRIDAKGRESEPICIDDEIPFEIPDSWEWARLGSLAQFMGGGTPDKGNPAYWNGDISWASMKDIHGKYLLKTIDRISQEGLASKPSITVCQPGQLIVSTRLIPGKPIISHITCAINQDLKVLKTSLSSEYLYLWFLSHLDCFKRIGMGTTVPGIKLEDLSCALVPIPPENEIDRIANQTESALRLITNQ